MNATFTDDAGTAHGVAGPAARIVSLVPSITELIFDLGLGDRLVGRTAFCVHPKDRIETVPSVGGTKRINLSKLADLRPTHVIVNIDETPKELAEDLAARGISVVVTHPIDVTDNTRLFALLGGIFGAEGAAQALIVDFEKSYRSVCNKYKEIKEKKVLYLIWKDPWMTISADTYIARMLDLAGWRTLCHNPSVRYPEIELTSDLLDEAELVLFSTEPYTFTENDLLEFRTAHPDHAHNARLIDAEMVSWYGSRAIAGLRYLDDFTARERA